MINDILARTNVLCDQCTPPRPLLVGEYFQGIDLEGPTGLINGKVDSNIDSDIESGINQLYA